MSSSLLIRDVVQDIRTTIDEKLARFDRAFFHSGGAEHSPLDFRGEFEDLADAVFDLELALETLDS